MVQVRAHQPINTDGSINLEAWLDHAVSVDLALDREALKEACEYARQDEQQSNAAKNLWSEGSGSFSTGLEIAEILADHNLGFIGPKAEHIRLMGDKIEAKKTAKRLGIPVVPGSDGAVTSETDALAIGKEIGFPVLVKAAAGGGGRGMKVAHTEADLALALSTAANEAKSAFGDASVYLEKYLQKPRHIEIQILGDGRGGAAPSIDDYGPDNVSLRGYDPYPAIPAPVAV